MFEKFPSLLAAAALLATAASAQTVKVPGDFATIQEAVINSADGYTIVVGPGTYNESVVIDSSNGLTLKASPKAVINPVGANPGLTITDCTDVEISGLHVADGGGGGILAQDCVVLRLLKCQVDNVAGDAIAVTGTLALTVDGCRLTGFGASGISAAGFIGSADDDDAVIRRCNIDGTGGGLYGIIQKGNNVLIEKNTIVMDPGAAAINLGFNDRLLAHVQHNRLTGDLRLTRAVAFSDRNRIEQGTLDLQGPVQRSTHDTIIDGELVVQSNSNIRISDAKVIGAGSKGVEILSNNIELDRVTVTDSAVRGIDCVAAFFVALEQVKIKNCARGVLIDANSKAVVNGCSITGCGGIGVDVLGDTSEILDNHIIGSGSDGVHLAAAASGNHLAGNVVKGSGNFDLDDQSGGANTIDADNVFGTTAP